MKTVKFIVPDTQDTNVGEIHEVPEADAEGFDEMGWQRADSEEKPKKNKK